MVAEYLFSRTEMQSISGAANDSFARKDSHESFAPSETTVSVGSGPGFYENKPASIDLFSVKLQGHGNDDFDTAC